MNVIQIENPASDDDDDDGWELVLTRDKFNELIDKKLRGTLEIVDEALQTANMKETNIDIVVCINE